MNTLISQGDRNSEVLLYIVIMFYLMSKTLEVDCDNQGKSWQVVIIRGTHFINCSTWNPPGFLGIHHSRLLKLKLTLNYFYDRLVLICWDVFRVFFRCLKKKSPSYWHTQGAVQGA